jgi:hypothetical protein
MPQAILLYLHMRSFKSEDVELKRRSSIAIPEDLRREHINSLLEARPDLDVDLGSVNSDIDVDMSSSDSDNSDFSYNKDDQNI